MSKKAKRRTPRKTRQQKSWRQFERLVSRIEATLAPQGAVVASPDSLVDQVSGIKREVDASIRYKVGSVQILIMIECRQRTTRQDVRWIEQLASKQESLRAAKCIAVSSSGFSKAAVKKALSLGIEVRHLRDISDEVIRTWTPPRTWFYRYQVLDSSLSFARNLDYQALDHELDDKMNAELSRKYYLEDKILEHVGGGPASSVNDYIMDVFNQAYAEIAPEKRTQIPLNRELILSFAGEPQYSVATSKGRLLVIAICSKVVFHSFVDYSIERPQVFSYRDQDKELLTGADFVASEERTGDVKKLTVLRDSDGRLRISKLKGPSR